MTIHVVREPAHEPEWPELGIQSADFRPTWDGDLVNVYSIVHPQGTRKETESDFQSKAREMARWIIANANQFGAADQECLAVAPTQLHGMLQ